MAGFLKVKLVHSAICREKDQKDTLKGLGLRKLGQVRFLKDTPALRGMVRKVYHLVEYEEASKDSEAKAPKVVTFELGSVTAAPKAKKAKAKTEPKAEGEKAAAKKAPVKEKTKKAPAKAAKKKA